MEPCLVGRIGQERFEAPAHGGVVVVEPLYLFSREHREVDGRCIDRTERERLKAVEAAVIRFAVLYGEECIFYAHAEMSGYVNARLVGNCHAGKEWHGRTGTQILAYLLRSFVHAQPASYAVSCSVSVIISCLPHGIACRQVKLYACRALRKTTTRQGDVSFEYKSVGAPLFLTYRSEGDGTRDVRCSESRAGG